MAICVGNIFTKYYQNLIIGFQVTVENVGGVFETQCIWQKISFRIFVEQCVLLFTYKF